MNIINDIVINMIICFEINHNVEITVPNIIVVPPRPARTPRSPKRNHSHNHNRNDNTDTTTTTNNNDNK